MAVFGNSFWEKILVRLKIFQKSISPDTRVKGLINFFLYTQHFMCVQKHKWEFLWEVI
jgi:hypothetical protein